MSKTNIKLDIRQKKILAIDYGKKVTGLAYFEEGVDFFPNLGGKVTDKADSDKIISIKKIIEQLEIDLVVLGIPKFLDGKSGSMTKTITLFKKLLESKIAPTPLYVQDETLSTFEAENRMKNSPHYNFKIDYGKIDEVSAAIILEDFLNANKNS